MTLANVERGVDRSPGYRPAYSRAPGCLWIALAGWLFLFLGTAGTVAFFDPTPLVLPYLGPPIVLAVLVLIAGTRRAISALSAVGGLFYATLGTWNLIRAADFEQRTPGAVDVSGGYVSVVFVLIAIAIALWSTSALPERASSRLTTFRITLAVAVVVLIGGALLLSCSGSSDIGTVSCSVPAGC